METLESERATAAHSPRAASAQDLIHGLRVQRLQSMALLQERRRLAIGLEFSIERLSLDLSRAFSQSVALRFMAIRQRHRASVARLMLPAAIPD
jgi:hypothetical protein